MSESVGESVGESSTAEQEAKMGSQTANQSETEAALDSRQPIMPQEPPRPDEQSNGPSTSLLAQAQALGLVRRKRRGGNNNPTGKGGFGERPQDRYRGGSRKRIPNSQKELKALLAELADEPLDDDGTQRLVAMLRKMMDSKSPVDHMEILNRLVGRQASKVDMTSGGAKIGWGAFIALTVAPAAARGGDADSNDDAVDGDVSADVRPALSAGDDESGA